MSFTRCKEQMIMAATQLVQTRIDGAIKAEAASVLAAMGLTVSDALRLLLTKVAQDKALPFEPLIPNAMTIQAMKDARAGRVTKTANLKDLFAKLNADTSIHCPVQARLQTKREKKGPHRTTFVWRQKSGKGLFRLQCAPLIQGRALPGALPMLLQ